MSGDGDETSSGDGARKASPSIVPAIGTPDATEGLLHAIVENIPHMLFVKDAERLAFALFNRAGEDLLGLSRDALLGKTDYDLFPEADAAFFQKKDRETLDGKLLVDIEEEPLQTERGVRWLHTKKVPILDAEGRPQFLLGISEDITERKLADAALREAKTHAEAASAELEAFSYSVAHDLRAPLRAIDGYCAVLAEDYGDKLDDTGHKHLESVRKAAHRMASLIDDLLTLSRATRVELRRERTDITAIASSCVEQLRRADPTRAVEVAIEDGMTALADPRLIAVALDNLIGNAWKFTSRKPSARIEVGAVAPESAGKAPTFFVRDDGAGFDMAYVGKLFAPFQRLHHVSEYEGTGIGLATVQRIMHRLGGRTWAEGTVDGGATIYFTLEADGTT
ncbi:MAG: PAS domain-containing protein [Labilithrix sp.]|nr:PAS domain-containing protein [Labilithrix sp.]